jgi:predicted enzyme related to lactoylglutathione lyase
MSASLKLEVDIIPVSDPDRSKQFYEAWAGG